MASSYGENVCPFLQSTGAPQVLRDAGAPIYTWKTDSEEGHIVARILEYMAVLISNINRHTKPVTIWEALTEKKLKLAPAEWNLVRYAPTWVAAEFVAALICSDSYGHSLAVSARLGLAPNRLKDFASGEESIPSADRFAGVKRTKGKHGGGGGNSDSKKASKN